MPKKSVAVLTSMVAGIAVSLASAAPAEALCADAGETTVRVTKVTPSWTATNYRTQYAQGPATLTFDPTGKTARVAARYPQRLRRDVPTALAKASRRGADVTKRWSKTGGDFIYRLDVARGDTARMRMFHRTRTIKVKVTRTTTTRQGRCSTTVLRRGTIKAPIARDVNLWRLQRR